jgi:hypothetical protein
MGTRHVTCVFLDGEYKVAQYGQWDGHFSEQGKKILTFLKYADIEIFKMKLRNNIHHVNKLYIETLYNNIKYKSNTGSAFEALYPSLSRDTGSGILDIIYSSTPDTEILIELSLDFALDSMWCEYGYVIDLDKNTFEFYKGLNKMTLFEYQMIKALGKERFFTVPHLTEDNYAPIRLKKEYKLTELNLIELDLEELEKI